MIISHSHKFIFIHIPKTAGLSISSSFEAYNYRYTLVNRIKSNLGIFPSVYNESFRNEKFHVSRHLTAEHIRDQLNALTGNDDLFNSYFRFSFVRNPYDILISGYEYVKASANENHPGYRDKNFVWMRTKFTTFRDYVLKFRFHHFPDFQYAYLYDSKGTCLIDYVGKVEDLHRDVLNISEKLKIPVPKVPYLNQTDRKPKEDYFTEEILSKVNDFYSRDFELFNYQKRTL